MPSDITFRPLETFQEYRECQDIQRETWGEESTDHVPASLISVAAKVGGVAAGAFLEDGDRMVGFVFGLAGWRQGRRVHWSHMLAVRKPYRGRGIGRRLKLLQRELLLEDGVSTVYWTYDPLVARNAHLNLNLLGARVEEFVTDMYGTGGDSPLHVGGATDRFVVRWELQSERVRRALGLESGPGPTDREEASAPDAEAPPRVLDPREPDEPSELPDEDSLRLAIPADAVSLDARDRGQARAWRYGLRRALLHYRSRGHRITGFRPAREEGRGYYLLKRR